MGKGAFQLVWLKTRNTKRGEGLNYFFYIGLHQKDKALLEKIKSYLGGQINTKHVAQYIQFIVFSVKDL